MKRKHWLYCVLTQSSVMCWFSARDISTPSAYYDMEASWRLPLWFVLEEEEQLGCYCAAAVLLRIQCRAVM